MPASSCYLCSRHAVWRGIFLTFLLLDWLGDSTTQNARKPATQIPQISRIGPSHQVIQSPADNLTNRFLVNQPMRQGHLLLLSQSATGELCHLAPQSKYCQLLAFVRLQHGRPRDCNKGEREHTITSLLATLHNNCHSFTPSLQKESLAYFPSELRAMVTLLKRNLPVYNT